MFSHDEAHFVPVTSLASETVGQIFLVRDNPLLLVVNSVARTFFLNSSHYRTPSGTKLDATVSIGPSLCSVNGV